MKKQLTNEQLFKKLFNSLSSVEVALLRERVVKISEMTKQALENDATQFEGIMWTPDMYTQLCNKIDEHIGFDK